MLSPDSVTTTGPSEHARSPRCLLTPRQPSLRFFCSARAKAPRVSLLAPLRVWEDESAPDTKRSPTSDGGTTTRFDTDRDWDHTGDPAIQIPLSRSFGALTRSGGVEGPTSPANLGGAFYYASS